MDSVWKQIMFAFFMGFVVPALLLAFAVLLVDG